MVSFANLKQVVQDKGMKSALGTIKHQVEPFPLIPSDVWGETFHYQDRRYYRAPNGGVYPSVTTFLGAFEDTAWLEAWRKRVGDKEADRISNRSADRGEKIHYALEQYLYGKEFDAQAHVGEFFFMYEQIRMALLRNLDAWSYLEHALYSPTMKLAGRVDLKGVWNGRRAIIDFKNKNRDYDKSDMDDYFLQACTYALMHEELYGEKIEDLVLVVSIENKNRKEARVFIDPVEKWEGRVRELANRLHRKHADWYDIPPLMLM